MEAIQSRFEEKLARSTELRQQHLAGIVQVGGGSAGSRSSFIYIHIPCPPLPLPRSMPAARWLNLDTSDLDPDPLAPTLVSAACRRGGPQGG